MASKITISVIVPSFNRGESLRLLLESLIRSDHIPDETIINDDIRTDDVTALVVDEFRQRGLNVRYINRNTSRSHARKIASDLASGQLLLHLDSDMQVSPALIRECVVKIRQGMDALVIPEESYGDSFWAKCRWFERRMYVGNDVMESLRCVRHDVYDRAGGHDSQIDLWDDKDMDIRVRRLGVHVGHTKNAIYHSEGAPSLRDLVKKKMVYATDATRFKKQYSQQWRLQTNILYRYWIFLNHFKLGFEHPLLYAGVFVMKTAEFLGAGIAHIMPRKK